MCTRTQEMIYSAKRKHSKSVAVGSLEAELHC